MAGWEGIIYRRSMKGVSSIVAVGFLALLITGCQRQEPSRPAAEERTAPGNPLTAPVDYLGAVNKAQRAAGNTLDTAAVKQAVQLFQAQEGRFPRHLNELVQSGYLARIPQPPSGMQWRYNPATGEVGLVRN
jgi:hypothetical protein